MDDKTRVELIRKGNELFNSKNIEKASKIFLETSYKDGLIRVGDFYFYEKKLPLVALKYYKAADHQEKVTEINARMIMALREWMTDTDQSRQGASETSDPHITPLDAPPAGPIIETRINPIGSN